MSATAGEALRLEKLTVARGGRPVVRDVSFEIPRGEVTALLGPNGAGKSSLVLAVAGVLPTEHGSIRLGEQELAGRRPERVRAAGVAVVPEGRRLLPELTVEDNLQVATYSLPKALGRERREYALELFPELKPRLTTQRRSLSGGEQQMVVLAQALVSEPKIILIDELSLGLAPVVLKRLIPTHSHGRRVGRRGAADRAVRDRRAGARKPQPRDGGRTAPLLRLRGRVEETARAAAVGVPSARQPGEKRR